MDIILDTRHHSIYLTNELLVNSSGHREVFCAVQKVWNTFTQNPENCKRQIACF